MNLCSGNRLMLFNQPVASVTLDGVALMLILGVDIMEAITPTLTLFVDRAEFAVQHLRKS